MFGLTGYCLNSNHQKRLKLSPQKGGESRIDLALILRKQFQFSLTKFSPEPCNTG